MKNFSKNLRKNLWKYLCLISLAITIALGTLHLFRSDLFYETDIARDMLLLEDMMVNRKLMLIGARSSIPGVFHGPLYYWLAFPFFAFSGGNPVVVSYFWLAIYWSFLAAFYYTGKKIFNQKFASVSTALIASLTAFVPAGFTHTTVSNFIIVPLIYLVYRYLQSNKVRWLAAAVITTGLIIQFQMAFGVPVLILIGGFSVYQIIKRRQFKHLLTIFLILLPLSTFLAFDLRHDFMQTRSAIAYLGENNSGSINGFWHDRWVSIVDCFSVSATPSKIFSDSTSILTIIALGFLGYKSFRSKRTKGRSTLMLVVLVALGFWVVTLPFQGNVWPPYYRTLYPVIAFALTYVLLNLIPKKIGVVVLVIILGSNLFFNVKEGLGYLRADLLNDEIHWKFYRQMASDIVADSEGKEFGYFVFSPDQYGYQGKYAMRYLVRKNSLAGISYQKRPLTYLIIALNNANNPWANEEFWQAQQVKIEREADRAWIYPSGYQVRRFDLAENEATISADPNLLDGIHFR